MLTKKHIFQKKYLKKIVYGMTQLLCIQLGIRLDYEAR